ncbi:MAG: ATP-binding protein [Thermoanaerobaculia bacterium]
MPMPKPGLRSALVLHVLLPVVLAMSVAAVLAVSGLERHMERRMEEDVELVARALQRPLARSLERGRSGAVEEALNSAFRIDRVFGAYVYDAGGETLATAGREESLPQRRRLTELAEEGRTKGEYGEVAGRNVYSYFVPLADSSGRVSALLQVTRRREDFESYFERLRWQAGSLLMASWIAVGGLVLAGHRRAAGRHLNRLLASMARVGAGERTHRAEESGPWEIGRLAHQLNDMLDAISRAEQELEQRRRRESALRDELRDSERLAALGRLAAGVAHELGTPLSVIDGRVQRTQRRLRNAGGNDPPRGPESSSGAVAPGPEVEAALDEVAAQVRRMESVVRQLLDFGRRGELEVEEVGVAEVYRAAGDAVRGLADERSTRLDVSTPPDDLRLVVDAGRLERVLINLLANAVHAAGDGRVRLGWELAGRELTLTVDDDGPGVPEDSHGRIFEPFFTTKRVGEGSGLGLAVVHGLVQELGGRIRVMDGPLGGARFVVSIPELTPGGGRSRG